MLLGLVQTLIVSLSIRFLIQGHDTKCVNFFLYLEKKIFLNIIIIIILKFIFLKLRLLSNFFGIFFK